MQINSTIHHTFINTMAEEEERGKRSGAPSPEPQPQPDTQPNGGT